MILNIVVDCNLSEQKHVKVSIDLNSDKFKQLIIDEIKNKCNIVSTESIKYKITSIRDKSS